MNYIGTKTNSENLTRFLHGSCGSPNTQIFIQAIRKEHYATWPHLNAYNVKKYLRAPTATILGRIDHQRKNKLTSKIITQTVSEITADLTPSSEAAKCNKDYVVLHEDTRRIHSDQTGRFPVKSMRGCQCIMIVYVHDANSILHRPLKIKQAVEMQTTCDKLCSYLSSRGHKPIFHRLDNELSQETQELLEQTMGGAP